MKAPPVTSIEMMKMHCMLRDREIRTLKRDVVRLDNEIAAIRKSLRRCIEYCIEQTGVKLTNPSGEECDELSNILQALFPGRR